MKNMLGDASRAERQKFTMAADQVAGDIVVENGMVGVLVDDALSGAEGVAIVKTDEKGAGPFAKEVPLVIARFDIAYWDTVAEHMTKTATVNTIKVGYFSQAGGSADTTISGVVFTGQPELDT